MKLAVAVLLLAVAALVAADDIPDFVRRGHFVGRSGNVVVSRTTLEMDESPSVLLVDQYHQHHTFANDDDTIEDVNVANLVSHIFQTAPPSNERSLLDIDRSAFPVVSLFHPPAANAFVVVEGVDYDVLDRFPTLSLLQKKKQVKVAPTYVHRDTLSASETLVTSVPPSSHGITGTSWINFAGLESFAFHDLGSVSHAESLFDSLAMTSPESLIVAMSSNYQLASVLGVRVPNFMHKANHVTYYWNSKHQTFDVKDNARISKDTLKSNRACILDSYNNKGDNFLFNYENVDFQFDEKVMQLHVTVHQAHVNDVVFDMNAEEDFILFAELHFLEVLLTVMQSEDFAAFIKDGTPDSFALGFAGIKSLREKYGVESAQFTAALNILDIALANFFASMNSLYNERMTHQVVFLRSPPRVPYFLTESLLDQLEEALVSAGDIVNFLPDIYLENGATVDEKALVDELNDALSADQIALYWFGNLQVQSQDLVLGERAPRRWSIKHIFGGKKTTERCYTMDEVNNFQVSVWTGVGLIITTFSAAMCMCLLNPEKNNELLYRQTALRRETDTIPGGEYDFKPL